MGRLGGGTLGPPFLAWGRARGAPASAPAAGGASGVAGPPATASHGPALPSRWATTNASRPAASSTRPSWTYVSRPNEWAKPPAGKGPPASCRSGRNAGSVGITVTPAHGGKHRRATPQGDPQP